MPSWWGDFGMGLSEEERRRAMREAIFRSGLEIQKRAGKEGFGAFSGLTGNIGMGLHDAGSSILAQRAAQAKAAEAARQQQMEDEAQELLIEKRRRELLEDDASGDEKRREIERRKAAIAAVSDPKLKGELELRIGQTNFWDVIDKKQAPPKEPAAPQTKTFADHTTRIWDPKAQEWKIVARKPPAAPKAAKEPTVKGRLSAEAAELTARKAAVVRLAEYEKDVTEGKVTRGLGEGAAAVRLPVIPAELSDFRKKKLQKFLAEERERIAFEQNIDPNQTARVGETPVRESGVLDRSSAMEQLIARELEKVPASKRREAEAELRLILGRRNL